ncbi:hypothetical protein QYF36_017950 [Acer negundo]|nr:hypothetical protein QYF36_017950 [Acer negundo]
MTNEGLLLQKGRLFTVVDEQHSSNKSMVTMLLDFLKEMHESLKDGTIELSQAFLEFLTSGICVAYPSTGEIIPTRLPKTDGLLVVFQHKFDTVMKCSTTLKTLLEEHNAIIFHFGFPYDYRHLNYDDLV